MFGVKINGRLGNQMFQYAFALAQQKRLGQNFFLDHYKYFLWKNKFSLNKYFNVSHEIGFANLLKKIFFYSQHLFRPSKVIQDQWDDPSEFLRNKANQAALYIGFFQSEVFFKEYRNLILDEFSIRNSQLINIKDFTKNNRENIVVHIRRGDYLNWGNEELGFNLSLPIPYYNNCLALIEKEGKNLIFISDDIEFVKKHFQIEGALYAEKNNEITDLQLIMQAEYLVLSNSSFSWWGAYLNIHAKEILVPKDWLGFKIAKEWPNKIICDNWKSVTVTES